MPRKTTVAICVATFRRPKLLSDLLESFVSLDVGGLDVHLLVVDNDKHAAAKAVVESYAPRLPMEVTHMVECERGIASARNRLVAEAEELKVKYIAFVDDDETVTPSWLINLVATAEEGVGDAVVGRRIWEFDSEVPEWIQRGGFLFEMQGFETGDEVKEGSTANVLFRIDALRDIPGPFDSRLDLSGGSDTMLFAMLNRKGARMVWCGEAVTREKFPFSRGNRRWLVMRSFRTGILNGRIVRWIDPSPARVATRLVKSLGLITLHGVMFPPSLLRGPQASTNHLREMARGLGSLLSVINPRFEYREYRKIHGV